MQSSFTSVGFSMDAGATCAVDGDTGRAGVAGSKLDDDANGLVPEDGDQDLVGFPAEPERHGLLTCEAAADQLSGSSSGIPRT